MTWQECVEQLISPTGSAQEQSAYAHMMGLDFYAHEKVRVRVCPWMRG